MLLTRTLRLCPSPLPFRCISSGYETLSKKKKQELARNRYRKEQLLEQQRQSSYFSRETMSIETKTLLLDEIKHGKSRLISLDVGHSTGIAINSLAKPTQMQELGYLQFKSEADLMTNFSSRVMNIVDDLNIQMLVIGSMPEVDAMQKIMTCISSMPQTIRVYLEDESHTTLVADARLKYNVTKEKRDMTAAIIIGERFLIGLEHDISNQKMY